MVDTIVLRLKQNMFTIIDHDNFSPSTKGLYDASGGYYRLGGRSNIACVQNPTKSELKSGVYKPRLTVTKRINRNREFEITLKIEFSLPKLIFGNNFDELDTSDFPTVIQKLKEILRQMGVLIFETNLINASVSAIHYSKNIPLTDGTTPHYYISKIKEANLPLTGDVNQTDYRNEGQSYKWHYNSYEVTFYDKISDLQTSKKSEKRSIEKENSIQFGLFDSLEQRKKFEVLRMEIRLNKNQKIKQILRTLNIQKEATFQNLFDKSVSQRVLIYYLDEIERLRLPLLDFSSSSPKALLANLVVNNPELGIRKTILMFGIKQALETITTRELRAMFAKTSKGTWYKLLNEVKKVRLPETNSPFNMLREQLTQFVPLKLVDFQDRMINNDKYN